MNAGGITQERRDPRFVQSCHRVDPVTKVVRDEGCIFGKPLVAVRVQPATLVLQGGGEIPVVEGCVGGEASLKHTIHNAVIDIEPGSGDAANAIVDDPGPREGEAVSVCSEVANQVKILRDVVQVITRRSGAPSRTLPGVSEKSSHMLRPRVWLDPSICQDDVANPRTKSEGIRDDRACALWISTDIGSTLSVRQKVVFRGRIAALHNLGGAPRGR
jgi:hypothetical protein